MATTIVYLGGGKESLLDLHSGEKPSSKDRRLIDNLGRQAAVVDNTKNAAVILDVRSARELRLGSMVTVFSDETRSGDKLHLPLVESISHVTSERIG